MSATIHQSMAVERPPRSLRVLIVDDDDAVRKVVQQVLMAEGYAVFVAVGAQEALGVLAAEGGQVDILLTDLQMPSMNGDALALQVRVQYPEVEIVVMSGSFVHTAYRETLDQLGVLTIAKPFDTAVLLRGLHTTLSRRLQA